MTAMCPRCYSAGEVRGTTATCPVCENAGTTGAEHSEGGVRAEEDDDEENEHGHAQDG